MNIKICIVLLLIFVSCTNNIVTVENEKFGTLTAICELELVNEKKIALDDVTATNPAYMQFVTDSFEGSYLTLLNKYNNSIYLYDYNTGNYVTKFVYEREGSNGILGVAGYYIKNMDSIYLYNRPMVELVLADSTGRVKDKISLKGEQEDWPFHYPQYDFKTICPIIEKSNNLLLPGFFPFGLNDSLVNKFRFTTCYDIKTNNTSHLFTYPPEIFGNNANWSDPAYMQVYSSLMPTGEIVHSFSASHNLYIHKLDADFSRIVYGGSNVARNIKSIDWDINSGYTPPEKILYLHYIQQDLYSAILYDSWREVYYRYMLQGIPEATTDTRINSKKIIIVILDKEFNYLGETNIGTGEDWNWNNSFITEEGLNIEYKDINDIDENFLYFKIFNIKKK